MSRTVDPDLRDPQLIARLAPFLCVVNGYFATEVRGWEHLPNEGPFLVVGNHSGGAETVDLAFLLHPWLGERGAEAPLYALAYDLFFQYPVVGPLFPRLGILPASRENARRAFAKNAAVVVFPGGDHEVFRAWSRRNVIDFGGHVGFVEIALECGVPVVPMTIHGAHQSTLVLTRGRRIARMMGLARWLHVNVFPIVWNIPFGPAPAFVPSITLPAKVTVEIGAPLDWRHHGAGAAQDPSVVRRCYDEITATMQATLDRLAAETPHPVWSRVVASLPALPWSSTAPVSALTSAPPCPGGPPDDTRRSGTLGYASGTVGHLDNTTDRRAFRAPRSRARPGPDKPPAVGQPRVVSST